MKYNFTIAWLFTAGVLFGAESQASTDILPDATIKINIYPHGVSYNGLFEDSGGYSFSDSWVIEPQGHWGILEASASKSPVPSIKNSLSLSSKVSENGSSNGGTGASSGLETTYWFIVESEQQTSVNITFDVLASVSLDIVNSYGVTNRSSIAYVGGDLGFWYVGSFFDSPKGGQFERTIYTNKPYKIQFGTYVSGDVYLETELRISAISSAFVSLDKEIYSPDDYELRFSKGFQAASVVPEPNPLILFSIGIPIIAVLSASRRKFQEHR